MSGEAASMLREYQLFSPYYHKEETFQKSQLRS